MHHFINKARVKSVLLTMLLCREACSGRADGPGEGGAGGGGGGGGQRDPARDGGAARRAQVAVAREEPRQVHERGEY